MGFSSPKWLRNTLLTILFCASGFLAIWIAKKQVGMQQEIAFVAFLILPILIYVIVAGRLLEFKAFGAEAKFADVAKQSVEPGLGTIDPSVEETEIVAKEGVAELQKRKDFLDETKPIILTLVSGKKDYHSWALEKYVEILSQCPTFKGSLILDSNGKFIVYYVVIYLTKVSICANILT